jgi:2-octaprenyl-6-methoxyphenol hydroxylase
MKVDVIIVGAGLNGLTAALCLGGRNARQKLQIAIIDRVDPAKFAANGHDSRASAITQATQTMFEGLRVWQTLHQRAQPMERIIVTDGMAETAQTALLNFETRADQKPAAVMIENQYLFGSLYNEIQSIPNIQVLSGRTILEMVFGPGLARVTLEDGITIKAPLIVGADGRNSATRQFANIKNSASHYNQSAITTTLHHATPHGGLAEEHFTPHGVFAVLPLTDNRSSIVWTEHHDEAQRLAQLSGESFIAELERQFGQQRGPLSVSGARHIYPLSMSYAETMVGERLALVGDAAHVVHPLAGLGLNLGFKDVAILADCVNDSFTMGGDIGSAVVLNRYEQWRRFDTVSTAHLIDGLNRLFANDNAALKSLRGFGLKLVDKAPLLKSIIMKEAAGLTGALPRLMQGLIS